jgi:hypothetical protein
MPAPMLEFAFTLDHPARVRQRLHVYPDGEVWYWATMPGGERVDHGAGSYSYTLDPDDLTAATSLAETLVRTPAPSVPALAVWGVIESSVLARSGYAERTHAYGHVAADDLAPAVRDANAFATATIARAEESPLSVIRLAIEIKPPMIDGKRGTLLFRFRNAGTEPVSLTVAPDSLRADKRVSDEWVTLWQLGGEPLLGLVSPTGAFLDGLLVPATLEPGQAASLTFLDAVDTDTDTDTGALRGVAAGGMALRRPASAGAGGDPNAPFDPYRITT